MMHEHSCTHVREHLEAFQDGELAIDDRIAIQNHLGECVACNLTATELASLSSSLRDMVSAIDASDPTDPSRISARVIERLRVEEQFSMRAQVTDWFQDMHLVWAGLGASAATLICIIGSASVLHATSQERPNSMARTISVLASQGSNDNPIRLNSSISVPRAVTDALEMPEKDAQYTMAAVVSREGDVQGVEMVDQAPHPRVNAMLNEAYRTKFAPATAPDGEAVAVSLVWLVANTTVKSPHDPMEALRQALRLRTTPAPISALPVPAEAIEPKPQAGPMMKPVSPEASTALAAAGGL